MTGFATAHGLARLTFTQRTIDVPLATKTEVFSLSKPVSIGIQTIGRLLVERRKKVGFDSGGNGTKSRYSRKWLGRWERGRAVPNQAQ